jgi:hypothetical protein
MILKQDNGSKIRINEQSRNQKVNKTKAKQSAIPWHNEQQSPLKPFAM